MSVFKLLHEMDEYYGDRVPYHDMYMSYTDNCRMEKLWKMMLRMVVWKGVLSDSNKSL